MRPSSGPGRSRSSDVHRVSGRPCCVSRCKGNARNLYQTLNSLAAVVRIENECRSSGLPECQESQNIRDAHDDESVVPASWGVPRGTRSPLRSKPRRASSMTTSGPVATNATASSTLRLRPFQLIASSVCALLLKDSAEMRFAIRISGLPNPLASGMTPTM